MPTLTLVLAVLFACEEEPIRPLRIVDLVDEGVACIDGDQVLVDFQQCLSTSCDTVRTSSCAATLEGDTLTITAAAQIASLPGSNLACSTDCGLVEARCDLPEGWEAATTVVYGETSDVGAACPAD
jgi:hypothetical protein